MTVSIPGMSTAVRGGISPLGRVPPGRLRPGLLAPSLQLAFNVTVYLYPRELGETHLGDEFQQFSAQLDPFQNPLQPTFQRTAAFYTSILERVQAFPSISLQNATTSFFPSNFYSCFLCLPIWLSALVSEPFHWMGLMIYDA